MLEGEEKLIKSIQGGETHLFGQLYDHYLPKIYRFVLLKVGQKEESEDIVHDVFINAWQNLGTYSSKGFPFSSWLYHIARNKVIDYYRLKKPTTHLEDLDDSFVKVASNAEKLFDINLDLEKVKSAIQKLTPEQQDVVIMKFVEDLTHQEIAAALNKSEGAVRLLQHRAINNLKNLLTAV